MTSPLGDPQTLTCPLCFWPTANPNDIREGWCQNCHGQTSTNAAGQPPDLRLVTPGPPRPMLSEQMFVLRPRNEEGRPTPR